MKIINGNKYSKEQFDDYNLRLIVQLWDNDGNNHRVDVYTTQVDYDLAWDDLLELVNKDKVKSWSIIHKATKEQDDRATELINEWLNEEE